jgi:hypothetical protein
MGIENRFVADVFNRLWPWMDHTKDIWFCHDDGGRGYESTPDLCFHFQGIDKQFRLECKVIDFIKKPPTDRVKTYKKQLETWSQPTSQAAPLLWLAKHKEDDRYYFWEHSDPDFVSTFTAAAERRAQRGDNEQVVKLPTRLSKQKLTFDSMVLEVLKYAHDKVFLR